MRRLVTCLFLLATPGAIATPATEPQPRLPTVPLVVGGKKLAAEIADEDAEREAGMMFRRTMAAGEAMVFVFDTPQKVAFWMKNTLVPLSVAYVNASGMILEIHDLKPKDETAVPSRFDTVLYAIEVPQGWFLANGILPGAQVKGLPAPKR
jgi:uncharacterized membrane protein (UPF0127 family)